MLSRADFPRNFKDFNQDLIAGATVAIVAMPLAIGFGITSGLSPTAGIATAIIAGFLAALLGGSRYQVSGPTGAMTVVLTPVIAAQGVGAVPILGLLSGILLIIFASLRLGRFIKAIPESVVEGFTVGIAILITLQQLPFALGVSKGAGENTVVVAVHTVQKALGQGLRWQTIFIVGITLLIKFYIVSFLERLHIKPYIPASFSALIIASSIAIAFHLDVNRIGEIPRNVLNFQFPHFDHINYGSLLIPALSIAILSAIEALLAARVADEMVNARGDDEFKPNQELFGQSIATMATAFVGGMPSTGAIARTGVNVRSRASSRLAAMFHAGVLLLITLFLAPLFSLIPTAAIAGVLIGTSFRIFNRASMNEIFKSTKENIIIFLTTAIFTLGIDLIWGITMGLIAHGLFRIFRSSKSIL